MYGYLGPSGAGKTTTIGLLLELHRPATGLDPLMEMRGKAPSRP